MTEKEIEFKGAIDDLIKTYKELKISLPRLFQMFANDPNDYVGTAKKLVNSYDAKSGYIKLLELKRLDLTIESLVADEARWGSLIDAETIKAAKLKLISS